MTTVGEKIISEKPCTTCSAKVGEKCKTEDGIELNFLHVARYADAKSAAQPKRKK